MSSLGVAWQWIQRCPLVPCLRRYRLATISKLVLIRVQSYFLTSGLLPISLGDKPLETLDQYFFFQLNTCGDSPYVTSSLTRGWVCRVQLLLVVASAVNSGPSPTGLMTTFYCLRFQTPPTWRARSPYLYSPGTGRPSYSSPPTTHRAMVEVFDPASTRGSWAHTRNCLSGLLYNHGTHPIENTASNSSIAASVSVAVVAVETCLLAAAYQRPFLLVHCSVFSCHVTIWCILAP
jgi:hypothetical protein